jgi:hypothetical protein
MEKLKFNNFYSIVCRELQTHLQSRRLHRAGVMGVLVLLLERVQHIVGVVKCNFKIQAQ